MEKSSYKEKNRHIRKLTIQCGGGNSVAATIKPPEF
jgi:hypothetical protein